MNVLRKRRLALVMLLVLGVSLAVIAMLFALKENINHYYSPTQIVLKQAPLNKKIRGGGIVVPGSLQRDPNSLNVYFSLSDGAYDISVEYCGILPDLFAEDSSIVAVGKVNTQGVFIASEILAKHDASYMPPAVKRAIDDAKKIRRQREESIKVIPDNSKISAETKIYKLKEPSL